MPKFSIIIPVYNVEKYIKKCLDSVFSQSYKDYEVIIINDGSTDKSMDIAKEYNVKIINQKNKGQSAARNNGIKHATGDYLIFLDSDDYWEKDLLKELNKSLKNKPDVIRFQINEVYDDGKIKSYNESPFTNANGPEAFEKICKYHFVETVCCYSVKREYYIKNKFKFEENRLHEDFGLIPLIIMKADVVNSISYLGYNYYQRQGSTMNSMTYEKAKRKVSDMYYFYKVLELEADKMECNTAVFKSFIANSMILKITELNNKDYHEYLKKLKKDKAFDNILADNFPRKIKKICLKISPKLFWKIMR